MTWAKYFNFFVTHVSTASIARVQQWPIVHGTSAHGAWDQRDLCDISQGPLTTTEMTM